MNPKSYTPVGTFAESIEEVSEMFGAAAWCWSARFPDNL